MDSFGKGITNKTVAFRIDFCSGIRGRPGPSDRAPRGCQGGPDYDACALQLACAALALPAAVLLVFLLPSLFLAKLVIAYHLLTKSLLFPDKWLRVQD